MFFVVFIMAFKFSPIRPTFDPFAMFLAFTPLACVLISRLTLILAFLSVSSYPMGLSVFPLTFNYVSISLKIHSDPMWLIIMPLSFINGAILGPRLLTKPVFFATSPLSFIDVSCYLTYLPRPLLSFLHNRRLRVLN